jgi:hypothetical protein
MLDGGLEACTFSNVAERAGVERSTLYRRYPDRMDMIIDTIVASVCWLYCSPSAAAKLSLPARIA